jgi:hypothetical protein
MEKPDSFTDEQWQEAQQFADEMQRAFLDERVRWLADYYDKPDPTTVPEVYPIVEKIAQLFSDKEYDLVEHMLGNSNFTRLQTGYLAVMLRTCYPARDKILNWSVHVRQAIYEIDQRGQDGKHILRGLL